MTLSRSRWKIRAAAFALSGTLGLAPMSCTPMATAGPTGSDSAVSPSEQRLLVPAGYGSLRQDEFTLTLREGAVQVKVTPLEEWILRLSAPDTYGRLSALRASHESALGSTGPGYMLFLVSFYSEEAGQEFHPEDLHLSALGRRRLPTAIRPMTLGWGTQRLGQRQVESAVYAFREMSLDADLVVDYRGTRNYDWTMILADLLAEQARVRGGQGGVR